MPDLILPHGGGLINRTVAEATVPSTTAIPISDADLSTLYRIADGGLSPLTGPMTKAEYQRVLEEEVVVRELTVEHACGVRVVERHIAAAPVGAEMDVRERRGCSKEPEPCHAGPARLTSGGCGGVHGVDPVRPPIGGVPAGS